MAEATVSVLYERAEYVDTNPITVRCTAPDALSNLVAVLELAADGQLRCSEITRRPSAATVKLVEDVLVAGDYYDAGEPIAAFAWPLLIRAGGLAVPALGDEPQSLPQPPARGGSHPAKPPWGETNPKALPDRSARGDRSPRTPLRPPREETAGTRLELTARGRAVLARPSYEALSALWARWLKIVSYDELSRIEAIKGQRKTATLTSAVCRRAAVDAGLAALEPGVWTNVDELFGILEHQQPPLIAVRSLMALWRLYIIDSYHGSLGHAGVHAWDVVEGRYALCVLLEYAATIGLIDVAYRNPCGARDDYRGLWGADRYACLSRYDGLVALRVNKLGAAILHDPAVVPFIGLPVPRCP